MSLPIFFVFSLTSARVISGFLAFLASIWFDENLNKD
jgi:hypothetical protein